MILGPGVKTGLNIVLDNPGEMGADRVADAVAALAQYPVPLVIVDMEQQQLFPFWMTGNVILAV